MGKEHQSKSKNKTKTGKLAKKKLCMIIGAAVIALAAIVVCLCLILSKNGDNAGVDFGQNITSADGSEFKSTYDTGRGKDFSVRFTELDCNEDCSNVSTVRIGDRTLKLGEDYEVKRGSVIIVIFKKVMQSLQVGNHDVVVDIKEGDKTLTVGVHITIKSDAPVLADNPSQPTTPKSEENSSNESSTAEDNKETSTETSENNNTTPKEDPKPAQPEHTETPKTCSDYQNCDFNLNDRYVIETDTYNFYSLPEGVTHVCDETESGGFYLDVLTPVETKTFYQIGNFTGEGGINAPHATPTRTDYTYNQAEQYATARGLSAYHYGWGCGGMGDAWREWTWQQIVDGGYALDEAKCATWGLSCGRW